MEKYVDMKSPLTGGKVKEVFTTEFKEFRKENFKVHVRYYVCEDSGEQFTSTEQDTLLFNDLYSQYRIKHGIPFPDEIKEIRKKYHLNYSQISKILGFGANQYARYEGGEVPSESNGKMIAAAKSKAFMLDLLKNSQNVFSQSEYDKILSSILMSQEKQDDYAPLNHIIFGDRKRSLLNGYGATSIPKLFEMVSYIIFKHGEIFPTKLNKLMFYSDFFHYRKTGESISGLQYRALNFGPVPDHYATIYDNIPTINKRFLEAHGLISTILSISSEAKIELISPSEKDSIDYVLNKLKTLSVSEIIEGSHKECGWISNSPSRSLIPYDEAFNLYLV